MRIKFLLLFSIVLVSHLTFAQIVWESPNHEVVNFLSRQAQKGNITFSDYIQPISRFEIRQLLNQLKSSDLTAKENKELSFYERDFTEFDSTANNYASLLKKDQYGRFRGASVKQDAFLLRVDPILTFETIQNNTQNITKESHGLNLYGFSGKHFSFQASFRDITEYGSGLDTLKYFTPETGIVKTQNIKPNAKTLNYSDLRGYISYNWKNGNISIGKDQNLWGYGENGRITLSDKAPSYPFIRFDYQPLKWLRFHYLHTFLQSALIDSNATYPKGNDVLGDNRDIYISKFLVSHSLNFIPTKGLLFSVGESMVYSDRFDAAYLIPVLFFKAYDQYISRYNINSGSNGQFFFQVSSRNHVKNTHLYGTLFIDEIRASEVFNPAKSRNQLGFNLGGNVTDIFIPYLTIGTEYTRINPFVYNNIIPAQTYANQTYSLGDWMGNNADRLIAYIRYTPAPRLKTSLIFQKVRKGGQGTIEQQYLAEPQPPFLFNLQREQTSLTLNASYEWINNLYLSSRITAFDNKNFTNNTRTKNTQFQFSISYGL